ncbi:MAG: hypothetical protein IPL53_25230 [Ignavibacteria bacterium]|nr:hypothetical protein [Ignavibacteria bacterium]
MKTFILIFAICILFQNAYSQQNTNGWYWLNSQPVGNDLNWVKMIDASIYYAVGDDGTFIKTTDGGDSWLVNNQAGSTEPFFGSGGGLNLFTAWFFDQNTGLVGGSTSDDFAGGKIKRTTDGGQTFSSIDLGNASGFSRVNGFYFINSNTGYLCGNNSVQAMKTTNGGLNWTLLPNLPNNGYGYNCVYAKDQNNIFLGVNYDGGSRIIVQTTNGGTTWSENTLPGTTVIEITDIKFQNTNTGFVSGNSTYFAYTTNGGSNWTQAIFPNNQMGLFNLKIIGSTVYALGSTNSYYYTSNLGVTWDSVVTNDPSNVNQPYSSLGKSFDIIGNDAVVVGMNGKINITNDGGSSWRNKNYSVGNNNYEFPSIFALPGTGHVWTGSSHSGLILYSSNSGANWTKQQTSALYSFYDIDMVNSLSGYAVGGDPFFGATGYCYKTTNGGTNWTLLSIPNSTVARFKVDFANANTGWIFGGAYDVISLISKTTNGGATWVNQTLTPANNSVVQSGDMIDANTGYCLSGFTFQNPTTKLYKTTNGGTNWNLVIQFPDNLSWDVVKTFSATNLYLGGKQNIYKSTNSGVNWTLATIPSTLANIFNMDWADPNNGTVVGTQGYTAKTSDAGLTWKERNTGSSTVTGVSMPNKDTVYASCDRNIYGAIFRLYDNSAVLTFNIKTGIQGFWNGTIQVRDTVKCHLRNSVSPYSEIGVVTAYTDNQGNAVFNFPAIPSGSYYLEITQRNSIETWSASPLTVVQGVTYSYDFTTAASQAFGNNMILKSGRYCDYSGDVNQNGDINLTDIVETYNASSNFLSGYVVTDVDGNNFVDLSDITIVYNNSAAFVSKITP